MKQFNFLGKHFIVYNPNLKCTENDLKKHISGLNILEALREINLISSKLVSQNEAYLHIDDILVTDNILIELAYKIILYGNLNISYPFNKEDFLLAIRMTFYLSDLKLLSVTTKPYEILMYNTYRQFPYQESTMQSLSRTLYLYNDLWNKTENAKHIDIKQIVKEVIGIDLEIFLLIGFSFLGQALKNGFFRKYDEDTINKLTDQFRHIFQLKNQDCFIKRIGADFNHYRIYNGDLNPLIKFPIVITHQNPDPQLPEVYIIPSLRNFNIRITNGLYYDLTDTMRTKSGNPFKNAFGHVFQNYIGILLKEHFKTWEIIPEIRYNKHNDTVDWFIVKDNRAIIIEVKQSSLSLESKLSGSLKGIKKDISKNIFKAIKQIYNTIEAIQSNKYSSLAIFKNITRFEKVIICYEPLYNAHLIVRELLKTGYEENTSNHIYHIINIDSFEKLLAYQEDSESLFELLYFKSITDEYKEMDFNEYLIANYPNIEKTNTFLLKRYDTFFSQSNVTI